MVLTSDEYQLLQDALLDGFPTEGKLEQFCRFGLEVDLAKVADGENLTHVMFHLIRWAESSGNVLELIDAAVKQNPNNPKVNDFVERHRAKIEERLKTPPPEHTNSKPAPGQTAIGVRLIRTNEDLMATLHTIVDGAKDVLACTGSRSRDGSYLTAIESKLAQDDRVTHYRVLFGHPHTQTMKDHLVRLFQLRNPKQRPHGNKNLFVGLITDYRREGETFISANQSRAFVRLPSLSAMQKYDTGLDFVAKSDALCYVRLVQEMYSASEPLETRRDAELLRVLYK